jgi:hypothetical protein
MSNGKIAHRELKLGESIFNLGTSMDGWPAHGLIAQIYVEDSGALFQRAVQAGAKVIMPMTDMFFGSREGRVSDPFGNVWTIATLEEEVPPKRDAATNEGRRVLSKTWRRATARTVSVRVGNLANSSQSPLRVRSLIEDDVAVWCHELSMPGKHHVQVLCVLVDKAD